MFRKRERPQMPSVNIAQIERESKASLAQATSDLAFQEALLRHETATTGRKWDIIIEDNNLAEKIRQAFTGE